MALTVLKKICDSPFLLSSAEGKGVGNKSRLLSSSDEEGEEEEEGVGEGGGRGEREDEEEMPESVEQMINTWLRQSGTLREDREHGRDNVGRDGERGGEAGAANVQEPVHDMDQDEDGAGNRRGEGEGKMAAGTGVADVAALLPAATHPQVRRAVLGSSKMCFCLQLVLRLVREGHRILIFSQSARMVHMLARATEAVGIASRTLTGAVSKMADRQVIIDEFNSSEAIPILLLTTGVGGVGITLTGADRVIIYDPSWNPATDAQAVDRAYRVGQTRPVLVYRLVTCGTVEEKIVRNQIFKRGLHKMVMQQENQHRYFTKQQLRDLFKLGTLDASETHHELDE